MKKRSLSELSELQKTIMEIVWEMGEATGRDVQAKLPQQKKLAYTTVTTLLKRLEKDGWLKHRTEDRTYIYTPAKSRAYEAVQASKKLIERVFYGDTRLLVQNLIEDEELSMKDLKEIKKMIDKKWKEKK